MISSKKDASTTKKHTSEIDKLHSEQSDSIKIPGTNKGGALSHTNSNTYTNPKKFSSHLVAGSISITTKKNLRDKTPEVSSVQFEKSGVAPASERANINFNGGDRNSVEKKQEKGEMKKIKRSADLGYPQIDYQEDFSFHSIPKISPNLGSTLAQTVRISSSKDDPLRKSKAFDTFEEKPHSNIHILDTVVSQKAQNPPIQRRGKRNSKSQKSRKSSKFSPPNKTFKSTVLDLIGGNRRNSKSSDKSNDRDFTPTRTENDKKVKEIGTLFSEVYKHEANSVLEASKGVITKKESRNEVSSTYSSSRISDTSTSNFSRALATTKDNFTEEQQEEKKQILAFYQKKLKNIEEVKKKPLPRKAQTEFYLAVFQEITEIDPNSILTHILKELKNGLHKQLISTEQECLGISIKETEELKWEISKQKVQIQEEILKAKIEKEKNENLERQRDRYKSDAEKLSLEINKLLSRSSVVEKQKKNNIGIDNKYQELILTLNQVTQELSTYKLKDKKMMYFLQILHTKGFPISEIYESEIKNIPQEIIKSFFEEESAISLDRHSIVHLGQNYSHFGNLLEDISMSFDVLGTKIPVRGQKKPEFVPELDLNDLLFLDSARDTSKTASNPEETGGKKEPSSRDKIMIIPSMLDNSDQKLNFHSQITEKIQLPNFDQMKKQLTVFSDGNIPTKPAGDKTLYYTPSEANGDSYHESVTLYMSDMSCTQVNDTRNMSRLI